MVGAFVCHQVDTRTDVGVGTGGHEFQGERVTAGGDAVGAAIVGAIEGTVLGACRAVWTERGVECVASVAVLWVSVLV